MYSTIDLQKLVQMISYLNIATLPLPSGSITDAMIASGSRIESRINDFVSLSDYGCVYDGSDETAKVQNAIAAIGSNKTKLIVPGQVKFSSNLTFGAGTVLDFTSGVNGCFIGTAGTELIQVQQPILAGPYKIFGNCVVRSTTGMVCGPEWFGALKDGASDDLSSCKACNELLKNVGGLVVMQPGTYAINGPINNFYSRIGWKGAGQGITTLKQIASNSDGIQCVGTAGSIIANTIFEGFNIVSNVSGSTNTGLILQYTALAKVRDMQIMEFFQGVFMQKATNTFFERVGASYNSNKNSTIGWVIDGGGTPAGGNASSSWRDCFVDASVNTGTGKIAFKASGAYVSDLYFSNCSSAFCDYGYSMDYSTATAGGYADVIIENPVIDSYSAQGIYVLNMPEQQMITIKGGWINPKSTGSENNGVRVENSAGRVKLIGTQISGQNNFASGAAIGVRVVNSKGVVVSGCSFQDNNIHIRESGSALCVYSENSFDNVVGKPATVQITLAGSSRSICTGNTHDGYATNSVLADNTSTGVGVTCSVFNAATLSAPRVVNSSSGPIGGTDGSTGLNSGV
jgi:hypothetical protein